MNTSNICECCHNACKKKNIRDCLEYKAKTVEDNLKDYLKILQEEAEYIIIEPPKIVPCFQAFYSQQEELEGGKYGIVVDVQETRRILRECWDMANVEIDEFMRLIKDKWVKKEIEYCSIKENVCCSIILK